MGHVDQVLTTMQGALARLDKANLGERAAGTIDELHLAVTKMNKVLDRLDGDKGLLASARSATEAFGEMGRSGHGTQRDLEVTLRDVSDAAEAIRSLASALERDPDMLLKGKTKEKVRR
jgi:paraquat-inducible protein B